MKINQRSCRWERRAPPTTRANSVQPPIKETQHIFALTITHKFCLFYSKYDDRQQRKASLKRNIIFFVIS